MGGESPRPVVDVEEIMAQVRARARTRTEAGVDVPAEPPDSRRLDEELARSLGEASAYCHPTYVDQELGWQTPIIGHAWRVCRRWIRREIRSYLDAPTRQQTAYNVAVARALTRIVDQSRQWTPRTEVDELRDEVSDLRRQVADLQARMSASRTGNGRE